MNFNLLKACTVNVNSVTNKVTHLKNMIDEEQLDIVSISETWLTSGCSGSFVDIPGFSLCRGDVAGTVRKHGAALYIRSSLSHMQITVQLPNIAVVHLLDFDLFIVSVYRPPSFLPAENSALIDFITNFVAGKEVIITGDFNLPSLKWSQGPANAAYISPNDRQFYDCFIDNGLTQWVKFGTFFPSGNILDLVLTTDEDRIGEVQDLPPLPGCHHCPVAFSIIYSFSPAVAGVSPTERLSWNRANFSVISEDLLSINWENSFSGLNVHEAYRFFTEAVRSCIDRFVPRAGGPKRGKWMSVPPRALTEQRKSQWQNYKKFRQRFGRHSTEAQTALEAFQSLNHDYRMYSKLRQADYEMKLANLISEAPKIFHGYLRERKKGCPSVGPLKSAAGDTVQSNLGMSEIFADAFASVFVATIPANPHPYQQSDARMGDVQVTYEAVRKILQSISPSSSAGADGIHPSLLHHCEEVLALPLSLIISKSLAEGVLPDDWKHSRVTPIFKAGSKFNPLNYRPVSVTSAPCKVAERLLANHILSYLECNNLLDTRQFGFRKGRSTEDQLLLSYGKIAREVDRGRLVDAVYLDYSKAFDVLSHTVLLAKAASIGFSPEVLGWIESFLIGRSMQVSVNGVSSEARTVVSGVPQGSVLGPLLFITYVNSLGVNFNCEWYSYADDLKLFATKSREASTAIDNSLQSDLNNLSAISTSWNLNLNPSKCVLIRFGTKNYSDGDDSGYMLGGTSLKLVKTHKDLGVLVDSSLRFHLHIGEVVRKSSGLANQLLRSTVCRSPIFMITLFISHIRPILDYCSTLWNQGYLGDVRRLESVQRRWTSNVIGMEGLNYSDRLRRLNLYSIQGRLLRTDLIKVWKSFCPIVEVGMLNIFERQFHTATRGHRLKLSMPSCRSETLRRFLSVRIIREWNCLPANVVEARTIDSFKNRLDACMGQRFFEVS